jgi:hypothetical protein
MSYSIHCDVCSANNMVAAVNESRGLWRVQNRKSIYSKKLLTAAHYSFPLLRPLRTGK